MTANQVWENWQNKDDTIAFTKGKEGRAESRIVSRSLSSLNAQIIFAASGKSHLKSVRGLKRVSERAVAASALSSGSKLRQRFSFSDPNKAPSPSVVRNVENTQENHPSLPFQAPNWKGYSHSPSLFTDVNSRLSEPLSLSLRRPRRDST